MGSTHSYKGVGGGGGVGKRDIPLSNISTPRNHNKRIDVHEFTDFSWLARSGGWWELSVGFERCVEMIDTWSVIITLVGNLASTWLSKYVYNHSTVGLLSWEPIDNVWTTVRVHQMAVIRDHLQPQTLPVAKLRGWQGDRLSIYNGDHLSMFVIGSAHS